MSITILMRERENNTGGNKITAYLTTMNKNWQKGGCNFQKQYKSYLVQICSHLSCDSLDSIFRSTACLTRRSPRSSFRTPLFTSLMFCVRCASTLMLRRSPCQIFPTPIILGLKHRAVLYLAPATTRSAGRISTDCFPTESSPTCGVDA